MGSEMCIRDRDDLLGNRLLPVTHDLVDELRDDQVVKKRIRLEIAFSRLELELGLLFFRLPGSSWSWHALASLDINHVYGRTWNGTAGAHRHQGYRAFHELRGNEHRGGP